MCPVDEDILIGNGIQFFVIQYWNLGCQRSTRACSGGDFLQRLWDGEDEDGNLVDFEET